MSEKTRQNRYEVLGVGTPIIDQILQVDDKYLESIPGGKGGMVNVDHVTFLKIIENSGVPPF